jgi:hypothetical protein
MVLRNGSMANGLFETAVRLHATIFHFIFRVVFHFLVAKVWPVAIVHGTMLAA